MCNTQKLRNGPKAQIHIVIEHGVHQTLVDVENLMLEQKGESIRCLCLISCERKSNNILTWGNLLCVVVPLSVRFL